ncbi:MAG: hypothetical protein U0517_01065 [Candidatus Andersenbacteria bacterium]
MEANPNTNPVLPSFVFVTDQPAQGEFDKDLALFFSKFLEFTASRHIKAHKQIVYFRSRLLSICFFRNEHALAVCYTERGVQEALDFNRYHPVLLLTAFDPETVIARHHTHALIVERVEAFKDGHATLWNLIPRLCDEELAVLAKHAVLEAKKKIEEAVPIQLLDATPASG